MFLFASSGQFNEPQKNTLMAFQRFLAFQLLRFLMKMADFSADSATGFILSCPTLSLVFDFA